MRFIYVTYKPLELNMCYLPAGTPCIIIKGLHGKYHVICKKHRIGSINAETLRLYFAG